MQVIPNLEDGTISLIPENREEKALLETFGKRPVEAALSNSAQGTSLELYC